MKKIAILLLICGFCAACPTTSENNSNKPVKTPTVEENKMKNAEIKNADFFANLPEDFAKPTEEVGKRLLKEYGAVFVARGGAIAPKKVIFRDEADVATFQSSVEKTSKTIGNLTIELQTPAMKALKGAMDEAAQNDLTITPRGADSAKRSYAQTVELWASRVDPGLAHWTANGKLKKEDAERIKALSPFEQVPEIFKLEAKGIFFAKDLSKSIIYSVAPPGTSQHLSMLALDVAEFENAAVRKILAKHGWFQTVKSDLPHFTFLGVTENALPNLGLKKISDGGRDFWLPDI